MLKNLHKEKDRKLKPTDYSLTCHESEMMNQSFYNATAGGGDNATET